MTKPHPNYHSVYKDYEGKGYEIIWCRSFATLIKKLSETEDLSGLISLDDPWTKRIGFASGSNKKIWFVYITMWKERIGISRLGWKTMFSQKGREQIAGFFAQRKWDPFLRGGSLESALQDEKEYFAERDKKLQAMQKSGQNLPRSE